MGQSGSAFAKGARPDIVDLHLHLGQKLLNLGQDSVALSAHQRWVGMRGRGGFVLAADDQPPVPAGAHVEVGIGPFPDQGLAQPGRKLRPGL
ncbi:hypothetical protein D3C72_1082850 [compost metagenome]